MFTSRHAIRIPAIRKIALGAAALLVPAGTAGEGAAPVPAAQAATRRQPATPAASAAPSPFATPFPTAPQERAAAWSHLPARVRSKTLSLDFRGADIDNVLRFYSMASGVTIAKAAGLKGPVTLINAKPLTLDEAFKILDGVLRGMGYELEWASPLLRVVAVSQRPAPAALAFPSGGRSAEPQQPAGVIRVFVLKHADAQQVARVISDLFGGRGSSSAGVSVTMPSGFGPGGGPGGLGPGGPGGFGPGGFWPGGFGPGGAASSTGAATTMPGQRSGGSASGPEVRATADTYTNSVLVNATLSVLEQAESVIQELDKQVPSTMQMRVFPLQCATASTAAEIVTRVVESSSSTRRTASATAQYVPFEMRVRGGSSSSSSGSSSSGKVVADDRTNCLFVTATPENLELAATVVKQLDQPVVAQTTTFVYPLANAQASEVASLLNQALRTLGSTTSSTSGYSSQRTSSGTSTYRSSGSSSGLPSSMGRSVPAEPRAEAADGRAAEVGPGTQGSVSLAPSGEAPASRQFMPFGGGGSGYANSSASGSSSTSSARTGHTDQGQWVSLLDMNGQANIVADTNTNSLIISTTPENYAAIRGIIEQLDVVPEQVMVEAVVAEAALDAATKLGVEWSWSRNIGGSQATLSTSLPNADLESSPKFKFSVAGKALQAAITALSSDSRFNILSTPRIFTANNREAEINISQQVPYVVDYRETDTGTRTYNIGYLDVGLVLTVTPHITKSGMVTVEVAQTANELLGYTTFNAPKVSQRSANTTITIRDGETIILGGMIRDQKEKVVNKVPLLGSIPLVGGLFRSKSDTTGKTELMVFLTPRIVRNADQALLLSQEQKRLVNVVIPSPQLNVPEPQEPGK